MNSYSNKKVLVTGGAGFIGSHLAESLAYQGARVIILDNLSTGNLENIKNIIHSVEFINGDICSKETCLKATEGVETIFHLAAFISVPESFEDPELCFETNTTGTENLLDAATKNNVKTFVFSSSAAIYGNRNDTCHENDIPNPQSPYAKSKLEGEKLCKEYSNIYNINTLILRYFNVYGDRQNPNSEYAAVIAKFTDNMKSQRPLTVFGTGNQTRDFIEVSEVIQANLTMGLQQNTKGETFNIATGRSIKILDLIENIQKQLKIEPVSINFMPARSGDILHSKADCSKYKNFSSKNPALPLQSNERFLKEL